MSHVTTTLNNTNSWPLTIGLPKRKVVSKISKPPFFSGYVSFMEGRWWFEPRFLGSNKQIQGNFMALWSGFGESPLVFPWFLRPAKFHPFRRRGAFASFPSLRLCPWLGAPCKLPEAPCRLRCFMGFFWWLKPTCTSTLRVFYDHSMLFCFWGICVPSHLKKKPNHLERCTLPI